MKEKILSWPRLKIALQKEKAKKRKIVFTNGCFDLVHVGHLKVFKECRKWGDVLVLGLNSDSSIKRIKGPSRPIVPEKERAELLAALELIDYVVIFKQDTPEKLIQLVRPDVLIKGGDWKKGNIVGADVAKKVVRVPVIKGRSTTNIIEKILKVYGDKSQSIQNQPANCATA